MLRMLWSRQLLLGFLIISVVHQGVWSYAHHSNQCSITSIPDYLVWLNSSLLIAFDTTDYDANRCSYHLYKNMEALPILVKKLNSSYGDFGFPLPMVTKEFDNASMTVIAHNSKIHKSFPRHFTIRTVDNVSAVINLTYSSNCTHTIVEWGAPYSHGLMVTNYYYELRLNDTVVESGVTIDLYVVFNLTSLPANEPGYTVSVWARAPPGNSNVTSISLLAALAPNVSYIADVAISSQKAIFILTGKVNPSCPTSYPTTVTILLSCVTDHTPLKIPVYITSNGSIEEIHSDAIKTGYSNCNVTVITSNFFDKNTSKAFNFSSTDVQRLVARPSEHIGAIYLWMRLARNSSIQEIIVNITSSKGNLVNTTRIKRQLYQREVNTTTNVLPVDVYSVSVFSCYNKTLIISKTARIAHSNYSTPVIPSSTATSTPITPAVPTTSDVPVIIGAVFAVLLVIGVAMMAIFVGVSVVLIKQYRKRHRGQRSFRNSDSASVSYGTDGLQDSCQLGSFSADNDDSKMEQAPILHKEEEDVAGTSSSSADSSLTPANARDNTMPAPVVQVSFDIPEDENPPPVDTVELPTATSNAISNDASTVLPNPVTTTENLTTPIPVQTGSSNALTHVQVTIEDMSMSVQPSLVSATTANVNVPVTSKEEQATLVVNEPQQTTSIDKATLPTSVEATTPKSEDTSMPVLLPPPPAFDRQRSIPSQHSITEMPRRPSQPVLQHSDVKPDQHALAIASSQSRPSLTSSDKHELPNLPALNIQESVKFKISELPTPSPPPSPSLPTPSHYTQELSYPTQETTYTTDDSQRPFIMPSPQLSSPSQPKPVHPVPESSNTANSFDQLIKDAPSSDPGEEEEDSYLATIRKEVPKKSKTRRSFVK